MKGYIIYLPSYPDSVSMASRALETGTKHGWNLELYEGVNGMKQGLADCNLKVYQHKFEHDVVFKKPMGEYEDCDVYKFEGFKKAKPIPPGNWYEGARAYRITPYGAKKILNWVHANGAMPADWMLCDGIVDMKFDKYRKVTYKTNGSGTKDLS